MKGVRVGSLIGELRYHMPRREKTTIENRNNIITDSTETLKVVHIKKKKKSLNPYNLWICERKFADVIKWEILWKTDYPGLCWWVWCSHKGPCEREGRGQRKEKMLHSWLWGWGKGTMNQRTQVASRSWKKQGKRFSLRASKWNVDLWTYL